MSRLLALMYGAAAYAVFLATFLYAIAFVAGVGVPRHVDNGPLVAWPVALAIDLALLSLFAMQHSGMARPAFKRWWTRIVPPAIERSTYVLVSSLVLVLLYWQWRPLPTVVWDVHGPGYWALIAISALGWLLVLASTFLINHFDLFGLRQVWAYARECTLADQPFVARAFYRMVRHPLMLGFLIAFWATPHMTVGHLLFAAVTTAYILVAVKFLEERDLLAQHGDAYRAYQREVPMIVPRPWHRRRGAPAGPVIGQRRPTA
ncbi:isoprenylcysteine carboxylmethyltransferase family protein [Luteimonas sp. 50]|uniref:methanethiol S-methyltransferase n=1 Tax=Cognatiluteimonas sedimenti TaxID=2927791 RepID=A0ABT0A0K5_9GAMM|nr:methanethiol S-methyltransferase [Lysobacter sedimenti]MCJ0824516.1 isoprenylcysteine carboxylmethyltransferase family protein [Lysobacter sedimenti]